MGAVNIRKAIEEAQLKIAEYGVAEAKAKMEKAQVELETSRLQQQHILQFLNPINDNIKQRRPES